MELSLMGALHKTPIGHSPCFPTVEELRHFVRCREYFKYFTPGTLPEMIISSIATGIFGFHVTPDVIR